MSVDHRVATWSFPRRKPILTYAFAVSIFSVALLVRFAVDQILPPGFPYATFFPAIIITAFLCGTGPGIVVSVLSGVAAWYFFIPPFNSFALTTGSSVALAFFVFIVGVDLLIIDRLMKALGQLEAERKYALRIADERDTLFREVQHRIGNNLQAISSLLHVQSRTVTDPAAQRALIESMQRVSIIADIQRRFHDPDRTEGRLDDAYVDDLARNCVKASGLEADFKIATDISLITLPQDAFLAVSLVLTECVNNALEHGVRPDHRGAIRITLKVEPTANTAVLTVSDNGPGLSPQFNPTLSNSIGLQVVHAFTRQLGGTFSMDGDCGTACRLEFPLQPIAG
jgi:two-component system, sensor histidine kinase PdtaS